MPASFRNDYDSPCHPRVLQAISSHLGEHFGAYGTDVYTKKAGDLIKAKFGAEGGMVYFLSGGTQTNAVMISFALRPYEAVIACDSGHINVHETGAVEGTGHKIIAVPNEEGKLTAIAVEKAFLSFTDAHMVKPKMVYISDSTECGTIYSKAELSALRKVCDQYGLYLFLDGARLGSALTSPENDLSPEDIGAFCDCFYVGGTKNGLLFGEALVVKNPSLIAELDYHIKNRGALLAKGFVAGIMFEEMFKDGLYFELAKQANKMAFRLLNGLREAGYDVAPSPTNQVFVRFPKAIAQTVQTRYQCEKWSENDDVIELRFVTTFLHKEEDIDEAIAYLSSLR